MSSQVYGTRTLPAAGALTRLRLLKQNSSGNWDHAASGEIAEAVCPYTIDATAATAGHRIAGELLCAGRTAILVAALAITTGDDVFSAASGKITNLKTGFNLGVCRQTGTADGDELEIELRPNFHTWFAKTAAVSTSISATAADTAYDTNIAIPAGLLRAGSKGRIRAKVNIATSTGTETMLFKVKIYDGTNTITLLASPALDTTSADVAVLDVEFELPTATTMVSNGFAGIGALAVGAVTVGGVLSSTYAPTAAGLITVTQTSSSTGETSALQSLSCEIRR